MTRRTFLLALPTLSAACGGSLTAPSPSRPRSVALAGQSNAILLAPRLRERVEVDPFWAEVIVMAAWLPGGTCGKAFLPLVAQARPATLVWSQGEADIVYNTPLDLYMSQWRAFVAGLWAVNPSMRIVTPEMGPFIAKGRGGPDGERYQAAKKAWALAHGVWVPTADLEWSSDDFHMTPSGYEALADRIMEALR